MLEKKQPIYPNMKLAHIPDARQGDGASPSLVPGKRPRGRPSKAAKLAQNSPADGTKIDAVAQNPPLAQNSEKPARLRKDGRPFRKSGPKPKPPKKPRVCQPRSRGKFVPDPMRNTRARNALRSSFERDLRLLEHEGDIEEFKERLEKVAPKRWKKPKYLPTDFDRMVTRCMSIIGRSSDDIGRLLGCDGRDIRREYKDELKQGLEISCSMVAGNMFKQAMKDSPSAVSAAREFLSKFGGFADQKTEISGPGGGPIKSASVQFVMHMHPGDEQI